MSKPINTIYVLRQDGVVRHKGTEVECLRALQRLQHHSAIWAMKYEGWSLDTRDLVDGVYVRLCDCCGVPMNEGYCFAAGENYACDEICAKTIARDTYDSTIGDMYSEGSDSCYYTEWDTTTLNDGDDYWVVSQLNFTRYTYREGDVL